MGGLVVGLTSNKPSPCRQRSAETQDASGRIPVIRSRLRPDPRNSDRLELGTAGTGVAGLDQENEVAQASSWSRGPARRRSGMCSAGKLLRARPSGQAEGESGRRRCRLMAFMIACMRNPALWGRLRTGAAALEER